MCVLKEHNIVHVPAQYYVYVIQENSWTFSTCDGPMKLKGTIAVVSADNPASSSLGGFKETWSANHYCRQCKGTAEQCSREVGMISAHVHTCIIMCKIVGKASLVPRLPVFFIIITDKLYYSVTYGGNKEKLDVYNLRKLGAWSAKSRD